MGPNDRVNILLVDDQPAKLMTYEVILRELGETLIKASSGREALQHLLKTDVAVVLVDVCMPELDGFELAKLIREHPRFQRTAIIFVSAVHLSDIDHLRGYEYGAVDYVSVPVVPDLLRAKVRVFAELYRKTRELELLNAELEQRVADRTAALELSMKQLRESEQRRSLALAAGRMGSWDWNLVNGEISWDEGQHKIFGLRTGELQLTEQAIAERLHPDDRNLMNYFRAAADKGSPGHAEFRLARPDGETRWCVASSGATLHSDGQPVCISGVTYDITERKQVEQALHQMNEELERRIEERTIERERALAQLFEVQKMDIIGQLTGGVAHDFNNLLMAVLGSLELLKKRLPDDPRALRLLDNAVQGAERGAALTQRLLAFARRQELRPEATDLLELIAGMQDLMKRAAGPGIDTVVEAAEELWPARIDANQFELALLNLIVNARDAMPKGGAITIAACNDSFGVEGASIGLAPGDYVRISVSDTGMGMEEAVLAKATEPFFTTKGPGRGTGLGLSMVHGITLQSGGGLQISSRSGEGTVVELWLPRAPNEAVSRRRTERLTEPQPRSQCSCTILIVDDDALVRTGTAAMLEDLGHTAIEASSGPKALEVIRSNRDIDLVVTDQAMPAMTGLELAREARRHRSDLPVIIATGFAELPKGEPDLASLIRLSKPFRQSELANAISSALTAGAEAEASIS